MWHVTRLFFPSLSLFVSPSLPSLSSVLSSPIIPCSPLLLIKTLYERTPSLSPVLSSSSLHPPPFLQVSYRSGHAFGLLVLELKQSTELCQTPQAQKTPGLVFWIFRIPSLAFWGSPQPLIQSSIPVLSGPVGTSRAKAIKSTDPSTHTQTFALLFFWRHFVCGDNNHISSKCELAPDWTVITPLKRHHQSQSPHRSGSVGPYCAFYRSVGWYSLFLSLVALNQLNFSFSHFRWQFVLELSFSHVWNHASHVLSWRIGANDQSRTPTHSYCQVIQHWALPKGAFAFKQTPLAYSSNKKRVRQTVCILQGGPENRLRTYEWFLCLCCHQIFSITPSNV